MTHENTGDFCVGESKEHCGCVHLSTCTSLTEKIIINCEKALNNANKGHLETSSVQRSMETHQSRHTRIRSSLSTVHIKE